MLQNEIIITRDEFNDIIKLLEELSSQDNQLAEWAGLLRVNLLKRYNTK